MVAGAGEVDEVDLSAEDDAPEQRRPPLPAPPSGAPRRGWRHPRRLLAVLAVAGLVVGAGSWHQHRALADAERVRAAEQLAATQLQAVQEAARTAPERRSALVQEATAAVTGVVGEAATSPEGSGGASGPPLWWPADLGARAAEPSGPLDLQVLGTWPTRGAGVQWVGFRLVTDLDDGVGRLPCGAPSVRLRAWSSDAPTGAATCRVMASGLRGTAVREGSTGQGDQRGELREVVLVSGGRAAAVAVWSGGGAPLPVDGPALGAAAAALLASAEPS